MACGRVWHIGSPSSVPHAPKHPWEETAKRITWHVCRKSIWSCFAATWGIAENFKAVSHKHPDAKTALGSYTARVVQHQPTCCCNGTKLLDLGSEEPLIYNSLLNWTLRRISDASLMGLDVLLWKEAPKLAQKMKGNNHWCNFNSSTK